MKSTIVLAALTSSAVAIPFAPALDAMFGTTFNNEARAIPPPDQMPPHRPIGTGSGLPFPFPTGSGALPPFPAPTGHHGRPHHGRPHGGRPGRPSKPLAIDYQLAPTAAPFFKNGKVEVKRQADPSALPSFSFLDPSDALPEPTQGPGEPPFPFPTGPPELPPFPTGTGVPELPPFPTGTGSPELPPFPTGGLPFPTAAPEAPTDSLPLPSDGAPELPPFPTGGAPDLPPFPTGGFPMPTGAPELPTDAPGLPPFPTGGFPMPTGGFPGLPTTLETLTRGPQPTGMPAFPGFPGQEDGDNESGRPGQGFWDWLEGLFGGRGESAA